MTFEPHTNRVTYDNYLLSFGKYRGQFLRDVIEIDDDYVVWLLETFKKGELVTALEHLLGKKICEDIAKNDAKRMSNGRKNKKNVSKNSKRVQKKRRVGTPCYSGGIVLPSELH